MKRLPYHRHFTSRRRVNVEEPYRGVNHKNTDNMTSLSRTQTGLLSFMSFFQFLQRRSNAVDLKYHQCEYCEPRRLSFQKNPEYSFRNSLLKQHILLQLAHHLCDRTALEEVVTQTNVHYSVSNVHQIKCDGLTLRG